MRCGSILRSALFIFYFMTLIEKGKYIMKRLFALMLALALLIAFAACGASPAQEEETTTEQTTQTQIEAAFSFEIPELPVVTTQEDASAQPAATIPSATAASSGNTTTAVSTTTRPSVSTQATTTTTTKPGASSSTITTTKTTTTTTTTTSTQPTNPPVTKGTFTVDVAKLQAMGGAVTRTYHFKNQYDEDNNLPGQTRTYTGVKLRDFLAKEGITVSALGSGAKLVATDNKGRSVTYSYNDIVSDNTLLAWAQDGNPVADAPRLCPGHTTGVNSLLFWKEVSSITLS